jgi:hypothetical protein
LADLEFLHSFFIRFDGDGKRDKIEHRFVRGKVWFSLLIKFLFFTRIHFIYILHAGTRHCSLTAAWAPYFDDMDRIIFLTPIRWGCKMANFRDFDQMLEEDNRVNRLVSFQLSITFRFGPFLTKLFCL